MTIIPRWLSLRQLRDGSTTATGRLYRLFSFFGLACKNTTQQTAMKWAAEATASAGVGTGVVFSRIVAVMRWEYSNQA